MLKNNVLVNVQKILENHYFEKIEKKLDSFLSSDLLEKKIEKNNLFNKLLKLSFIDKISEILKSPD
jgi:formiminotetrahydrofolate cyclodeaminase